jgi:CRP/FNR family transcriptional regulator, anaerobic regulatory protein
MTESSLRATHSAQKVACNDCNLTRICIPSGMEAEEIQCLSHVVKRNRTLRKGEVIYRAGERFTGIYALKSGSAKLIHTDAVGRESIIAVLLPGELVGFDGLYSGKHRCTLVALETSSYCELPAHDLEQLGQKVPSIQQVILQRTGEQFDLSIERLAASQRPAEERLAGFLLDLAGRYQTRGFSSEEFHLSLTRQEIGNHLGLALETVSRLLGRFETSDIIRVKGKFIHILDVDGLRKAAGDLN